MAATKKFTAKNADFAKGGKTKMFGKQHTGPQKPDTTAHKVGGDGKFASGGSNKMFGYNASQAARAGITSAR